MFQINFDFNNHLVFGKLLAINLPVLAVETLTYPLLRAQSMVLNYNIISYGPNDLRRTEYQLRHFIRNEKFPKLLTGLRYSLDHSITYTTMRFLLFEYFSGLFTPDVPNSGDNNNPAQDKNSKWSIYGAVLGSTIISTLIAQPSFNYRTLASSIQPKPNLNINEHLKNNLIHIDKKKVLFAGMKYSLLINVATSMLELSTFVFIKAKLLRSGYEDLYDVVPAFSATILGTLLTHPLHYLRVQEINNQLLNIPKKGNGFTNLWQGITSSMLRRTLHNSLLFGMYSYYFVKQEQMAVEGMYKKRKLHSSSMAYREGMPVEDMKKDPENELKSPQNVIKSIQKQLKTR